MCKLFNDWSTQIEKYCIENNLSFEKAKKMSKCWSKNDIVLQYYDETLNNAKNGKGLLNETPMPIVLMITKTDSGLLFEQTEHTRKYLSA